jgi:glycosyltransferase involved in cell wall biosynthesis
MEARDLWPQTIIDMGELSAHHPITKALQSLERFLYLRAERVITLLPLAHEYITACGIPEEKIIWIPNGVDLSRFEALKPISAKDKAFTVMYLGAHGQANALDVLIRAAKVIQDQRLDEIRFVLIGDGPEKPRLMALAKELGLQNVEFRDPIKKAEVPRFLQGTNALIFNLERVEVFKYGISPNKIFDYMASGSPIIFSVEAPNNPIEEARCGLTVPPRDPKAMAEAVVKLYKMSQEEREVMGKRGREYVERHHDITKLAERLEQVLVEITHGGPANKRRRQ